MTQTACRPDAQHHAEQIVLAAYRVVGCYQAGYGPGAADRLLARIAELAATCAASDRAYDQRQAERERRAGGVA